MSKLSFLYDRYEQGFKYNWYEEQSPPSQLLAEYMRKNPPPKSKEGLTGRPLAEWWIAKMRRKDVGQE